MGSRERKRAERRKRKQRSAQGVEPAAEPAANGAGSDDPVARMAARSEERNRAAREALEPLGENERPTAVTIGAVIAALIALSAAIGWAAGIEVTQIGSDGIEQGEDRAPVVAVLATVALMGTMAWGMWKARYWAVLGFQALLVIVLVAASLGLLQATEWTQAVGTTLLIAGGGALFYFMIKAMARIQMPERLPRDE
ncbi:MAG: hypothetical protein ACRDK9_00800 [Solirubrobacterales bacterium]